MPFKTYQTIGILNRYYTVKIGNRTVSIAFTNGVEAPVRRQGRFATKDKSIQAYLENSGDFNVKFRLVSTVDLPEDKPSVKEQPPQVNQPIVYNDDMAAHKASKELAPEPNDDDLGTVPPPDSLPEETDEDTSPADNLIIVDEVINGQGARNYLMEHFKDLTFRQLANNQMIIAEAKSRDIQFVNWEAFVTAK